MFSNKITAFFPPLGEQILGDRGRLDSWPIVPMNNKGVASKKWHIIAIIVGSLIVLGIGGFGILGLIQSHGIISLPHSLQWLTSAIGAIGHTSHFWSLWVISLGGLALGSCLIAHGANRLATKQPRARLANILQSLKHPSVRSSQFSRILLKKLFKKAWMLI